MGNDGKWVFAFGALTATLSQRDIQKLSQEAFDHDMSLPAGV